MVKLFLFRGVNINVFDKKDRRVIYWVVYMGMYFLNLFLIVYLGELMYFGFCIFVFLYN